MAKKPSKPKTQPKGAMPKAKKGAKKSVKINRAPFGY